WRLCRKDTEDDVQDEIVVRVQGILTKNNLVPKNVHSCSPAKAQFLSQHAELCGFRSTTFQESMAKLTTVHEIFQQHLVGINITPLVEHADERSDTLGANNRIFTLRSDAPTEQDNSFQVGVDPMRLLSRFKAGGLIHAPENIVKYFKKPSNDDDNYEYEPFFPGGFKVGDIVEMQVCFIAVASGRAGVKMTTRLQALTLLSNEFSMVRSL
ncbi:hypothetical protein B0H19DRAFT_963133, partial [Mycena capillaripes]